MSNRISASLIAALAALTLASCSKQETLTGPAAGGRTAGALTQGREDGIDGEGSDRDDRDDNNVTVNAYALTESNILLGFDRNDPRKVTRQTVTGLGSGVRLLGIDFRSANGQLYGLGSDSRIYVIDVTTGVATAVGTGFTPALQGSAFGFDFNPVVDRIRVVSNTGQNLRINPDTGALAASDSTIMYSTTDPNAGRTPSVTAVAYLNPDNDAATGTTLYDIEAALDVLTTQNPPNNGRLNTVGTLGNAASNGAGFDITLVGGQNIAYLAIGGSSKNSRARLFTVNLATGATTVVGRIDHVNTISGLAIPTTP